MTRNTNDVTGTNDSTILSALTSNPAIQYVARGPEGHVGIFWVGAVLGGSFVKRAAIRLYVYYSPNFEFAYTGSCQNHKHFETERMVTTLNGTDGAGNGGGEFHAYNWINGWNHPVDCCFIGPNSVNYFGVTPANARRGKWWRVELVTTNRAGGASPDGFRGQIYEKNVTDGGQESLVLDTRGTFYSGIDQWLGWDDLTPPFQQNQMTFAAYRQNVCAGYYAFSHIMVAGWDTDANQRIGAATEVEGGGGGGVPGPPTTLRISVVSVSRFVSYIGFVLLGTFGMVGIVLGASRIITRRHYASRLDDLGGLGGGKVRGIVPPATSSGETEARWNRRRAMDTESDDEAEVEAIAGAPRW